MVLQRLKSLYARYRLLNARYFVISYPKSGRTWLRVLVAKALALHFQCKKQIVLDSAELIQSGCKGVPWVVFTHAESGKPVPVERYDRVFEKVFQDLRLYKKHVILLVRDPRDVVVSDYFQKTKRSTIGFSGSLSQFIHDANWGIDRIIYVLNTWYRNKDRYGDFLMLRYEDFRQNPETELRRVLAFLDLTNVSYSTVKQVVEYASFENMRNLVMNKEAQKSPFYGRIAPKDPKDPESHKIRKGKVGGYQDYLSEEKIEYVDKRVRALLCPEFGYE